MERIASDLGISEAEVPETAPRYVLTEPTVSTVIPGKRSKRNVERNIAVTDDRGPDERRREKLHATAGCATSTADAPQDRHARAEWEG